MKKRERIPHLAISRIVALLAAAICLAMPAALADEPASSQARCHCPCTSKCGHHVSCECPQHPKDCEDCHCVRVGSDKLSALFGGLDSKDLAQELPAGYIDHSPWFDIQLPDTVKVGIGGTRKGTFEETDYVFTMRLADRLTGRYVVDEPADLDAWQEWLASIDPDQPAGLSIAAITDPASWTILDGDRKHLNESIAWRFHLVVGGKDVVFMRKDSTPAWETWTYLRSALGQLPDGAFAPGLDPDGCRARLFGMLDTFHVLVEASFFDRAREEVDRMKELCEKWLVPDHRLTPATLGALRKVARLLGPAAEEGCR